MGTTAQKLQRVLDTKEGLKDTINTYLGQDITSAIPFKDYETYIKNFYGSLPKTSYAEGSNITLSNTLKGKLDFEDGIVGYGQTEQKSYEGYNVYNSILKSQTTEGITVTKKEDGTYILNGTCTANNWLDLHFGTNQIDETKNYRITAINSAPSGLNIFAAITKSDETIQYPQLNTANGTVIDSVKSVLIFVRINSGITLNNIIIKPMVSSDISKTYNDYEPYVGGTASPSPSYPQDIEVVRGTQTVYIKDENNNIIDTKTINLGEYEFAKIGNYVDTIEYDIDEDKVYKNEVIEEHTGTELAGSFQLSSGYSDSTYLCAFNNNFMVANYVNTTSLCNYFSGEYVYSIQKVANNMRMGPSALVICVLKSDFADINALNQYFTDNGANIKFLLVSKTPTKKEITGTLKDQIKALYNSHSFTGTTIIEIDGQLPLIIKVRALKGE